MRVTFVDNVLLSRTDGGYSVDLQPHLGLISLIAVLRQQGHAAMLYDPKLDLDAGTVALRPGVYAELAARIATSEPEIVGFTALGCNFVCTLKIARALRASLPGVAIMLGGPHASILDREIIERYHEFDVIARQEAETTIGPLVEALAGRGTLGDVCGITFRRDGIARRTPDAGPVLDLDALPFPAYDAYPIAELGLEELRVDAGRGCPFRCTFCSTASFFGRRYRLKSAARLVEELLRLRSEYGVERFGLSHDLFTVNKVKVREFCRAVEPYGLRWSCSARIDCVDDDLLAEMRNAGCHGIYYGVETGSARMQHVVAKDLDLALYHPRVTKTLDLGMQAVASFITGYPEETIEDQNETLELIGESVRRYSSDLTIQLHVLTPEPGTLLYEQHPDLLAYDGHLSDFVFPPIEPDDETLIREDGRVFVCHQYFAAGVERARTIEVAQGFWALSMVGRAMLRKLAGETSSFSALVRNFGSILRASDFQIPAALVRFGQRHFGCEHPLTEIMRFVGAQVMLRVEPRQPLWQIENGIPLRLARCIVPIDAGRDGAELLRRIADGEALEGAPVRTSHWLLVATPDLRGRMTLPIDPTTFAIVKELERGASLPELADRFENALLTARLEGLCMFGAVVPTYAEGEESLSQLVPSLRPPPPSLANA
jgi:radical SAM superfamily enzyme YgiQ (UPF0313 family)